MKRLLLLAVTAAFAVLSGCAAQPVAQATPDPADAVTVRIEQTAQRVERMLAEMNSLENSRQNNPNKFKSAQDILPADHPLMKRTTAIWAGDVRIVVRKLADQFGMDVVVKGKSPTPLMVSVSAKDQPFVSILESIGSQTGNVANITCDVSKNLLQIEYR